MSSKPTVSPTPSAFLETIIAALLPYFTTAATDLQDARSEIIDTLACYATRTRAGLLQAAQIIAFGMTTLDALAEARTAEMSPSMRIRYRGCANGLNRSSIQMQKMLDQRLTSGEPTAARPVQELVSDIPDTTVRPAAKAPVPGQHPMTREERNKRLWAGAMMDTLKQMGYRSNPLPDALEGGF